MEKKWYVVENIGDEMEEAVVELTEDEAKAVRKFLDTQIVVHTEDFVGRTLFFDNKPYNTKEEAIEAVKTCDYYR